MPSQREIVIAALPREGEWTTREIYEAVDIGSYFGTRTILYSLVKSGMIEIAHHGSSGDAGKNPTRFRWRHA